jgi:hypothetical protein
MTTIEIKIKDNQVERFLQYLNELKSDIIDNIKIKSLNIESIDKNSSDYKEIMAIKKQNNKKYSLDETKKLLGL